MRQAATHQSAGDTFDPGRFTDITGSFWKLSSAVDKVSLQSSNSDPKAIGHYVFDQGTNAWKQGSPTPHAAVRVKVEIDRSLYKKLRLVERNEEGGGSLEFS